MSFRISDDLSHSEESIRFNSMKYGCVHWQLACKAQLPKETNAMNQTNHRAPQRGQTMLEYLLLIALIAVGSIGIITVLGDTLRVRIQNAANELVGEREMRDAKEITQGSDRHIRKSMENFNH